MAGELDHFTRPERSSRHQLSLSNLGRVALDTGDYPSSRAMWEESRAIAEDLGDRWGYAWSLMNLGDLAYSQNDCATARTLHQESLSIRRELGNRPSIADSLERLAGIASQRAPLRAALIWGAVERLRAEIAVPLSVEEQVRYNRLVDSAREASGNDATFDSAWQRGRNMTLEQAIACALESDREG